MNIIVIGGSAGALPAVKQIFSAVTSPLDGAVFIVIHFPEDKISYLPKILGKKSVMPALHASDGCVIEKGKIYIAPPARHMIIKEGKTFLSDGPKENRFRPSIDVLFRSAATAYGPMVTGIILSGALDDGVAGLIAIKKSGGATIVQDPTDAIMDGLPLNALKNVKEDYCLPAAKISAVLKIICDNKPKEVAMKKNKLYEWENAMADGHVMDMEAIKKHTEPTRYICPLCEGPLFKLRDFSFNRYRCFVGHAFSGQTLLNDVDEKVEHLPWTAYRTLDEKKEMLKNMVTSNSELKKQEEKINHDLQFLDELLQNNTVQ